MHRLLRARHVTAVSARPGSTAAWRTRPRGVPRQLASPVMVGERLLGRSAPSLRCRATVDRLAAGPFLVPEISFDSPAEQAEHQVFSHRPHAPRPPASPSTTTRRSPTGAPTGFPRSTSIYVGGCRGHLDIAPALLGSRRAADRHADDATGSPSSGRTFESAMAEGGDDAVAAALPTSAVGPSRRRAHGSPRELFEAQGRSPGRPAPRLIRGPGLGEPDRRRGRPPRTRPRDTHQTR